MSLFIASLNSGSNGNCYYIGNGTDAVFIDAGLSCRDTEERMERLGLSMDAVKAIFISHEHSDHIAGLSGLTAKYGIPVYITPATLKEMRSRKLQAFTRHFEAGISVDIGALSVLGFRKFHDACDPHSFVVSGADTCIGIFTDIGRPCDQLKHYFSKCQAAFLEANYDEEMLRLGKYPWFLKNRIQGGNGHLSNRQAMELFRDHRPEAMTHLLLSHLSRENNRPELVQALFDSVAGDTTVLVASRSEETLLYQIHPAPKPADLPQVQTSGETQNAVNRQFASEETPELRKTILTTRKRALRRGLTHDDTRQLRLF